MGTQALLLLLAFAHSSYSQNSTVNNNNNGSFNPTWGPLGWETVTQSPGHGCAYSPLRADRDGSRAHDVAFAWTYAVSKGLEYRGPICIERKLHAKPPKPCLRYDTDSLFALLELPFQVSWASGDMDRNCTVLDPHEYRSELLLRDNWLPPPRRPTNGACVIHVR